MNVHNKILLSNNIQGNILSLLFDNGNLQNRIDRLKLTTPNVLQKNTLTCSPI